jgi:hypothetical protein
MSIELEIKAAHALGDVLEVKFAVVTKYEGSKCDEELGERRVYVHEVLRLDVLAGEFAKVYFVKTTFPFVKIANPKVEKCALTRRCSVSTTGRAARPMRLARWRRAASTLPMRCPCRPWVLTSGVHS